MRIKTLITIPEMLNIFPTPIVFEREKPIMLKISENRAVDDVKIRIRTELPLMANAKLSTKFRSDGETHVYIAFSQKYYAV